MGPSRQRQEHAALDFGTLDPPTAGTGDARWRRPVSARRARELGDLSQRTHRASCSRITPSAAVLGARERAGADAGRAVERRRRRRRARADASPQVGLGDRASIIVRGSCRAVRNSVRRIARGAHSAIRCPLLCDEPTGNLDRLVADSVASLLLNLTRRTPSSSSSRTALAGASGFRGPLRNEMTTRSSGRMTYLQNLVATERTYSLAHESRRDARCRPRRSSVLGGALRRRRLRARQPSATSLWAGSADTDTVRVLVGLLSRERPLPTCARRSSATGAVAPSSSRTASSPTSRPGGGVGGVLVYGVDDGSGASTACHGRAGPAVSSALATEVGATSGRHLADSSPASVGDLRRLALFDKDDLGRTVRLTLG